MSDMRYKVKVYDDKGFAGSWHYDSLQLACRAMRKGIDRDAQIDLIMRHSEVLLATVRYVDGKPTILIPDMREAILDGIDQLSSSAEWARNMCREAAANDEERFRTYHLEEKHMRRAALYQHEMEWESAQVRRYLG